MYYKFQHSEALNLGDKRIQLNQFLYAGVERVAVSGKRVIQSRDAYNFTRHALQLLEPSYFWANWAGATLENFQRNVSYYFRNETSS